MKTVLFSFTLFFLLGCQSRPIQEMALADLALKAAQKNKADALAPDSFRKAENYYLRAKKDYQDGYFDSSRRYSRDARLMAEQAEFQALIKQNKAKMDDVPKAFTPQDSVEGNP